MTRIAMVTGANQGIGFAIAEGLAARLGPDDLVLLTGRNAERVTAAVERIKDRRVEGRVLDVRDTAAVASLAAELGAVDIVVSNAVARLLPDRSQSAQADEFIDVANGGTHAILRSFAPILHPGGRLLVVASALGTLGHLDPALQPLFDGVTLAEVEHAVQTWRTTIHDGTAEEQSWPRWLNLPSKVAAVRAVAAQRRDRDLADGVLIASVCPGLVDTPLSRPWFDDFSQAQTPQQAARAILDLLTGPLDPATYGELVRFGTVLPWHDGTPPRQRDQLLLR